MTSKEKTAVIVAGAAVLGAIAYLLLFAPIGSLGSADGQSYEVDPLGIIGYLMLFLVVGFFVVRWQSRQGHKEKEDTFEQERVFGRPRLKERNPALEVPGYSEKVTA